MKADFSDYLVIGANLASGFLGLYTGNNLLAAANLFLAGWYLGFLYNLKG